MAVANPVPLSPRQREILRAVVCNRANKEIAAKFNITVRTVKFHISTLLNKFGVDNRIDLARRATGVLRSSSMDEAVEMESPMARPSRQDFGPVALDPTIDPSARARHVRFQRILSA